MATPGIAAWKRWVPSWAKRLLRRGGARVQHRSINQNVYHCTVQKSASQWLRVILSDPRIHRTSGLSPYRYQEHLPGKHDPRRLTERRFAAPFPGATIVTPMYLDYEGFASIPKPARYKAFFVMRDPRDVLVSWYFSSKFSHPLIGDLERVRRDLHRLSEPDGMLYTIDYLDEFGLFAAQRSWANADARDENVLLLRYEDLISATGPDVFARLFRHCDIQLSEADLESLLDSYRFESLSGRPRGQEDRSAHFRKGVAGDWRNHFTDQIDARFHRIAGDLISLWHYT